MEKPYRLDWEFSFGPHVAERLLPLSAGQGDDVILDHVAQFVVDGLSRSSSSIYWKRQVTKGTTR